MGWVFHDGSSTFLKAIPEGFLTFCHVRIQSTACDLEQGPHQSPIILVPWSKNFDHQSYKKFPLFIIL